MNPRNFCFSHKELQKRAMKFLADCERDYDYLKVYGMELQMLSQLERLINEFGGLKDDKQLVKEKAFINTEKKRLRREIVMNVRSVQLRIELSGGTADSVYLQFKQARLHNVSDIQFLDEIRAIQSVSHQLSKYGVSGNMLGAFIEKVNSFKLLDDKFTRMEQERSELTTQRVGIANRLYMLMSQMAKIGKLYWKEQSNRKYKDYILY